MNIVEYFVRLNLRRKIAALHDSVHDIEERLAELDSLLDTWETKVLANGRQPSDIIEKIANWRAERAKLRVRTPKLARDIVKLETELKMEYSKQRSV